MVDHARPEHAQATRDHGFTILPKPIDLLDVIGLLTGLMDEAPGALPRG